MTKNNFEAKTTSMESLRGLCQNGLETRYNPVTEEIQARLDHELSVIETMGLADFFLKVYDIICFAREQRIVTGPGRGSSAGSLVFYALGVTQVDPIRYGLKFERFINPLQKTQPKITIDVCKEELLKITDYVNEKYGETEDISFACPEDLSKYNAECDYSFDTEACIPASELKNVFLLRNSVAWALIDEIEPERIEEIAAILILKLPIIDRQSAAYISGKRNPEAITYLHPLLKPILSETYGCILYQEQVTEILEKLAGYPAAEAELARVAISKKKPELCEAERDRFVDGCVRNGIDKGDASAIFEELIDKTGFTFNKSHAIAYAILCYQTARLNTEH